jgi:hypothetical protein
MEGMHLGAKVAFPLLSGTLPLLLPLAEVPFVCHSFYYWIQGALLVRTRQNAHILM